VKFDLSEVSFVFLECANVLSVICIQNRIALFVYFFVIMLDLINGRRVVSSYHFVC